LGNVPELNKLIVLANCNFIKGRELNRLIAGPFAQAQVCSPPNLGQT